MGWQDSPIVGGPPASSPMPKWASSPTVEPEAEESPSLMDRWNAAAPRRSGAAKSVLNTLTGVYDVLNMGPDSPGQPTKLTARQVLAEDITPTPEEEGGYTAGSVAQFLLPTPVGKGKLAAAALNAAQSGGMTYLQGGTGGETATSAAIGAAGPLASKAGEVAAPWIQKAAETQYGRALAATTKPLKKQAQRIVPELLKRGVYGTLESLAEKGAAKSETFGKKLGTAYESVSDAGVKTQTAPVVARLDKVRKRFFATTDAGEAVAVNPGAVAKIDAVKELVEKFAPEARPDQLWALRKNIDDVLEATGGFSGPLTPGTTKSLQYEARTALQKELSKANPDIKKLNRHFSLWQGLEDVAKATIDRKVSQTGIVELGIRSTIGTGAGYFLGDDPRWATVGGLLGAVTKHPLYRTFSASQKARLAFALSKGNADEATSILSKAIAGFATGGGTSNQESR